MTASYEVTQRGGCTLVNGAVPVGHFVALAKTSGEGAVMSAHLARLTGVSIAWGPVAAVDALVAELSAAAAGPTAGLDRWLRIGEHGQSSLAIVKRLAGKGAANTAHPHDPDDLRRCVLLLDMVPELRPRMPEMADVSPEWAALAGHWPELEAMFAVESERKTAPKLYARMRELIDAARA